MIDVQSGAALHAYPLVAAGVTNIRYPAEFVDVVSGEKQRTVANWQISVAIPSAQRGTHMSRMIEEVHELSSDRPLGIASMGVFARKLASRLGAKSAEIEVSFPWNRNLPSPVTRKSAWATYDVAFCAALREESVEISLRLKVPVKSVCPCSKAISERGAHNQRSLITVDLQLPSPDQCPWSLEQVISGVEACGSSPLYLLLKREDEKRVTEDAFDNPVFVEDLCRRVATFCDQTLGCGRFKVRTVNFESIHPYDCFAELSFP